MKKLSGQEMLDYIIEHVDEIADAWQVGFVEDREANRDGFEDLSRRQQEIVEEIYEEIT